MVKGSEQISLLGPLLQGHELVSGLSPSERDERLKEIGIILFGGGTDTVSNLFQLPANIVDFCIFSDVKFYYELYRCYGFVPPCTSTSSTGT
ncbi:hypothetical protein AG1IA_10452 [Rhizoctonia solani AG-1 IA]|uniref:Uncharacterized protein n=1 Tax=Thanatephorus cucumeris (strain AG1-IA) TaxID=983506 RepID=L8WFF5_THACA|nr:hypothetical protein AG1IA_10452 [Rhizoctonia solani AG-1 IA]